MERIKTLNYYQKGIIIVMVAMILIFAVIYPRQSQELVIDTMMRFLFRIRKMEI